MLAAGAGRRIGTAKALLSIGRRTLVERGADLLRTSGCDPCLVVLGAQADQVLQVADLSQAEVVVAHEWSHGQSYSLRAGIEALRTTPVPAVVIALVDQPLVTAAVIDRLVSAWQHGATAAAATYGGRMRTPVLLRAEVLPSVLRALHGDRGAGPWLRAHPDLVVGVEVADVADGRDIDTADDLRDVRSHLAARPDVDRATPGGG